MQRHDHHTAHGEPDESTLADTLDRDAEDFGPSREEVIDLIEQHLQASPRAIVDIGAGTGTGSLALARRFPDAEVIAIDSSEFMLERLRDSATAQGMLQRVRTVHADLDTAWPDVGAVDIAWAALSLHHLAQPSVLLRQLHSTLSPGALLAVIELDDLPLILSEDSGFDIVEQRSLMPVLTGPTGEGGEFRARTAWLARRQDPSSGGRR